MSSRTVDSRHFAEEFVRRRALAEKGKVAEPSANTVGVGAGGGSGGQGGWSEVAKKGGSGSASAAAAAQGMAKEKGGEEFRVVAAKKGKGRK